MSVNSLLPEKLRLVARRVHLIFIGLPFHMFTSSPLPDLPRSFPKWRLMTTHGQTYLLTSRLKSKWRKQSVERTGDSRLLRANAAWAAPNNAFKDPTLISARDRT